MKGTDHCYSKVRSCEAVLRQYTICTKVETRTLKTMMSWDTDFVLIFGSYTQAGNSLISTRERITPKDHLGKVVGLA
jgi:hypothetical protein